MKLALFQMKIAYNPAETLEKCINAIHSAKRENADLILFPELTLLPFFPQYSGLDVRDKEVKIEHGFIRSFQNACKENQIYAVPNFYLKEKNAAYDASIMIDRNGEIVGVQKMVHIAQAEHFYEQDYY